MSAPSHPPHRQSLPGPSKTCFAVLVSGVSGNSYNSETLNRFPESPSPSFNKLPIPCWVRFSIGLHGTRAVILMKMLVPGLHITLLDSNAL